VPPGGTRFISVGRLEIQKDHDTLLRAYRVASPELPGARLVIVGDGTRREELGRFAHELGVAESVTFAGFVANPYPAIATSDVLVLSSRFEGMPNVVLEALALGRGCVSTDCPSGPAEILVDPALGRLVPVGDVSALAAAMVEVARNPPDPSIGPAHVRRHHSPQVVHRAYQAVIAGTASETR
jgi:glycosyltransferase involved in cell wall biosynthesis